VGRRPRAAARHAELAGWSTACPDWEARLLSGRPLVPTLPLFADEAARALRTFKRLRLPDVIGTPLLGDAAGDWFLVIVEALFGSYDAVKNRRLIQEVFLLVPKKNGKSSFAAAVMVTAIIVNRRPNAEFLLIAPTKEIADIAFSQAKGMIECDEALDALFHRQPHIRTITHRRSGATIKIKAADTDAITGAKSTGILVDETHVFAAKPRAAEVFIEIRGALAARPDGFMFQISTQSKTPPSGVFRAELNRARSVRDGRLKLPLLPVIYELPTKMARDGSWKQPPLLTVVNPNLGRSLDADFLIRELEVAEGAGPAELALFASQHANVEIGLGLQSDRWAGADFWERQAEPALSLSDLIARCEVVTAGIDGGGLDDLFGLAFVGREIETRRWLMWCHAWCHSSALERRKSEAPRLLDFERAGDLTIVRDLPDDIGDIVETVMMVEDAGKLASVGLDPVGIGAVVDALADKGIVGERVIGIPQGWKLADAIKTAERKLADGTLVHAGQGIMAWCVGNAKVEPRGNAIMITKQAAGTAKIDPLMAAFNAVWLMGRNPDAQGGSIYDSMSDETAKLLGVPTEAELNGDTPAEAKPVDSGIDHEILANPRHPLFQQMRERYDAQMALADADDF
jgi:phage terminase large subunit-like protein